MQQALHGAPSDLEAQRTIWGAFLPGEGREVLQAAATATADNRPNQHSSWLGRLWLSGRVPLVEATLWAVDPEDTLPQGAAGMARSTGQKAAPAGSTAQHHRQCQVPVQHWDGQVSSEAPHLHLLRQGSHTAMQQVAAVSAG